MNKALKNTILTLILLLPGLFAGCAGSDPQVSGIVAIANFEAVACEGSEKTFNFRNDNTSEPQRIQGVLFEMGTNEDKFFKILDVSANGQTKTAVANLVEEILLPPGGVMKVRVEYNPKEITSEDSYHDTYLDVFMNGPKLGIIQVELRGRASTAAEGCTNNVGDGREFQVTGVKTVLSHNGLGGAVETDLNVESDVSGNFILNQDGDNVILTTSGWPTITFPLPPGAPLPELDIVLAEDSGPADFSTGDLTIEDIGFVAGGVINLSGLDLTTGSVTIDSSEAPDVAGGSITLTGSPLNDQGEMTLVVAAPLTVPPVDTIENVGGGVFGLVINLKEIP